MIYTAEQTREAYRMADEIMEVAKLDTLQDTFEVVQIIEGRRTRCASWFVARYVKGRLIESEVFDNAADARTNLIERLMNANLHMDA